MAGNIKGITIQFRANTTEVSSALSKIKKESKGVDAQLKDVNRALKFNPGNAELIAQKQELLKQKVQATKEKLDVLKQTQKSMDASGIDKTSKEYQELRREIITTESQLKRFTGQLRAVSAPNLQAIGAKLKSISSGLRQMGTAATVAGAAMVVAGKKLLDLNQTQLDAETKLIEIYKTRMGVTEDAAKSTMELAAALQQSGVIGDEVTLSGAQQLATFAKYPETVNTLLPAMDNLLAQQKGLNATSADATSVANLMGKAMNGNVGALTKVGITFTDAQKEVLKYGNEAERAAMLAEVITDNVGNMNEALAETDAGKIQQAKNQLGDIGEQLGASLLPALANLASAMQQYILPALQKFVDFMNEHPKIASFVTALAAVLTIGGPILLVLSGITGALGSLFTVIPSLIGGISSAIGMAGTIIGVLAPFAPIILGIVAAVAAVILIIKNWSKITAVVKGVIAGAMNAIKASFDKVMNAVRTVGSVFARIGKAMIQPIENAKNLISKAIAKIKSLFSGMHLKFPHVKVPHFNVNGGKAPYGIGGKGSKPSISIDWYKQGGIFSSPSIIGVGEAGPEAVLPIEKLQGMLAVMADSIVNGVNVSLAAAVGGPTGDIVIKNYLYPSGPEMGKQVVSMYDTYKRRLG